MGRKRGKGGKKSVQASACDVPMNVGSYESACDGNAKEARPDLYPSHAPIQVGQTVKSECGNYDMKCTDVMRGHTVGDFDDIKALEETMLSHGSVYEKIYPKDVLIFGYYITYTCDTDSPPGLDVRCGEVIEVAFDLGTVSGMREFISSRSDRHFVLESFVCLDL